MNTVDPKQGGTLEVWGHCRRCGHTLLREDAYCPYCGAQRDWGEIIR